MSKQTNNLAKLKARQVEAFADLDKCRIAQKVAQGNYDDMPPGSMGLEFNRINQALDDSRTDYHNAFNKAAKADRAYSRALGKGSKQ